MKNQQTKSKSIATLVRPRSRGSLTIPDTSLMAKDQVKELARTVFLQNRKMNAAKGFHDLARKTLLASMKQNNFIPFRLETTDEFGAPITLEVKVETPKVDYIDIQKLHSLVDEKTFLRIVSATKKSVVDNVGSIVCTQCTAVKDGTENVFVAPAK